MQALKLVINALLESLTELIEMEDSAVLDYLFRSEMRYQKRYSQKLIFIQ